MTISEATVVQLVGPVVGVYRRCDWCEQWKPLEHFLLLSGGRAPRVIRNVHVCAACRGAPKARG